MNASAAPASAPATSHAPRSTPVDPAPRASADRAVLARLWRGRASDPAWVRPALWGLLAATAVLYLWDLSVSGWANSFYSAAAQAGSASWKAFFFGSSDAANSITVDKTPLALWPMDLAVRIFGLSSWSILVPQALEGVASVGLLYAVVRRSTRSPIAGLIAGATLALTPVAVLMFRFNNPDALLVLLLIGSVWATLRALDSPKALRWVALAGALVGLAFLAKMLQAFLVLPALAATYLLFARTGWGRRALHLLVAFGSMVVAAGWWVAIVALWPASSRPYIGGSQHNSILELTLGYNGFGRLNGDETGSVGGGGGWGQTGLWRLFTSDIGGDIAWLLPAALIVGVASWWLARRDRRIPASMLVWLGWLVVTGLTFSFMAGIFHPYYTVALAPAIAALVGTGAWVLWAHRRELLASAVLGATVALTAVLSFVLLGRADGFVPWLRWAVLVVGLIVAFGVVLAGHLGRRLAVVVALTALLTSLAGPAAYAVATARTAHTGSIPTSGPSSVGGFGGAPGGGFGGGFGGGRGGTGGPGGQTGQGTGGTRTGGTGGIGGTPGGQTGGSSTGGLLDGSTSSAAMTALLEKDAGSYTWVAAAVGSNTAAGYQLATSAPVMAIGGFNGSDPSPTLAEFEALVKAGKIHYFIASGGGGISAGGSTSSAITSWVEKNYTKTTVGGVTVYDLTKAAS